MCVRPALGRGRNVTLLSHCGTCCVGVNTDARAIPDAAAFADALHAGFDEVLALSWRVPDANRAAPRLRTPEVTDGSPVGRRVFLGLLGLGAVGVRDRRRRPGLARARRRADRRPKDPHRPLGVAPDRPVPHLHRHRRLPRRAAGPTTRCASRGLVDRPLELSFADLRRMPPRRTHARLPVRDRVAGHRRAVGAACACATCSTRRASQHDARAVRFMSFDGAYSESLTLRQARRDDVLVAYELEGEPLSSDARRAGAALRRARCTATSRSSGSSGIELTRRGRARVLGAAGLRRRRVGRSIERPRRRADMTRRSAPVARAPPMPDRAVRPHRAHRALGHGGALRRAHAHRRRALRGADQHARRPARPRPRRPRRRRARAPGAVVVARRRPLGRRAAARPPAARPLDRRRPRWFRRRTRASARGSGSSTPARS